MAGDPGISVVLPNYCGKTLLEANLPSLKAALDAYGAEYEVIIVDDASGDDSVAFLEQAYPEFTVIKNTVNRGFSATCNRGIRAARYPLTCVANTDVTFDVHYFKNATPYFDNADLFAVKGPIVNYAGSIENVFNVERTTRLHFKRGFLRFKTHGVLRPDRYYDLEFVLLGCCFLADSQKLKDLGGFDEIYSPYYWEDSDLPLRAIREGYHVAYAEDCTVYHHCSSTIAATQTKLKRKLVSTRNKFLFAWAHMRGKRRWAGHLIFLVGSLATRWMILDFRYYLAFGLAVTRRITWNAPMRSASVIH